MTKVRALLAVIAVIGAMLPWFASTAQAGNVYWGDPAQVGTGSTSYDWMTAIEWSPNTNGPLYAYTNSGVTASSTVYFIGAGTNTITVNTAENLNGGAYPSQIHIGDVGANENAVITLNYNLGTAQLFRCSSYFGVGWSAPDAQSICTAVFNENANVNVTGSGISVGRFGSVGTLNLNAGTLTCSGIFNMANSVFASGSTNAGQATLNINGGKLTGATTFTIGAGGAANAIPVPAIGVPGSNTVAHATVNINSGIETQASSGTIIFCNGNNTVGTLNLNGGEMIAGSISKASGKTNTLATFNFNGGTLVANKSSITFMPSGFDSANVLSGGAFINTSTFNITIGSDLQDGGGGGGLTLSGTGTLTLSGTNNTYTGPTIVTAGTLLVSGLNGTASVFVNSNATFGAAGEVAGPVMVSSNGTLTAFQTSATLSMASLTLGAVSADTTTMNFTANGAAPLEYYKVSNSGGLTNNGICTVNLTGVIFPGPVPNTNTLITYNGSIQGGGTFVLGTTPGVQGYLLNTGSAIDLVVTNYTALTWVGYPNNNWNTSGGLVWENAGTSVSYADGDNVFFDNAASNFNVSVGTVNPGVAIISSSSNYTFSGNSLVSTNPLYMVGPGSLTFTTPGNSMSTLNLDGGTLQLPGSDTIGTLNLGGGILQVLGSDTATTYNWTGGTIQIDNGGSSGLLNFPASTTIPSGGAVVWDRSDSPISTVSFGGAGSFEQIGSGNLTLTAASPLTGSIIVTNGTLTLDAASTFSVGSGLYIESNGVVDCLAVNALGSGGSGVTIQSTTINSGGLLTCDGNSGHVYFNKLTLNGGVLDSGSATGDQYGTFACSPGSVLVTANSTISAVNMSMVQTVLPITVNNSVTLTVSGYWADTQSGGGAGTYAGIPYLTLIGPGKVVFTAGQNYTGDTTITNSAVLVLSNGAFLDSSNIVLAGGTVDVTGQSDGTLHLQNQPSPGTGPYNFGQSLVGVGTILGNLEAGNSAVSVAPGGSYWGGTTGTITVSGNITLGGTTRMELNRGGSPNCDQLASLSSINYGGTLIVTNIGSQLQAGDTFTLFSAATGYNGSSFSSIVLPNYYTWDTSQLAVNGSVSVVTTLPPPTISGVDYSQMQSGILAFNATNGAAGGSYTLLTSTNLALPLSQWTMAATGSFDGSGNLTGLSVTNTVGPQRFYILSAQ